MRDLLDGLLSRWSAGQTVGLATVVSTFSSAPRAPGSSMIATGSGEVVGSVSGGCIDGAVYDSLVEVVESGAAQLLTFGVSDENAFAVGLTCGGIIDVFVESVSAETFPELASVADDIAARRPVAVVTVVEHQDPHVVGRRIVVRPDSTAGTTGVPGVDEGVLPMARAMLDAARTGVVRLGADGDCNGADAALFVAAYTPQPRMIIFGGNDFAGALVRQARLLGYRVTVCDARPVFATPARFPDADEVVVDWPHRYLAGQVEAGLVDERTALCVLTHDPKFDIPLLELALRDCPAGYVGAMGSRTTHAQRAERLKANGVTDDELDSLASPIGLNLGGGTPEETAVSIMAEVVMVAHGGNPSRLSRSEAKIHPNRPLHL